jgi:hypothetical protein
VRLPFFGALSLAFDHDLRMISSRVWITENYAY